MKPTPPAWLLKLLRLYCNASVLEEVEGDLNELFEQRLRQRGLAYARLLYGWDVLRSTHLIVVRRKPVPSTRTFHAAMLPHHLTIALRTLRRNKASTLISITGLVLGIAASLLIGLWIREELRMDAFHAHAASTYYVMERQYYSDGKVAVYRNSAGLLPEALDNSIPELALVTPLTGWTEELSFRVGNQLNQEAGHYAGKDFFSMFSFPLLAGTPRTALGTPDGIVISRKLASKYFGSPGAAMGKTIRIDNRKDVQVSGVFEDVPYQSSLKFDFLLPYQVFLQENDWALDWEKNPVTTFIQLRPDADPAKVEAKLKSFLGNYRHQTKTHLFLQRFDQAYLYSRFTNGQPDGGRIDYVRLFGLAALFILLIACINFTNLVTAQAGKRAKEVGIRKVLGAQRPGLVGQFLSEALLLTLSAALTAVVLVWALLPWFNQLTGKHVILEGSDLSLLGGLGSLTLLTSVLAGGYPALLLSSLQPVQVLKGLMRFSPSARFLRRGLLVVQFTFSLALLVGTLVIYRQVTYLQEKNLGFDREHLVYLPLEGRLTGQHQLLKQELARLPGITAITMLTQAPTRIDNGVIQVDWPGKSPQDKALFTQAGAGFDLVKTLKLTLLAGRDFSPYFRTDTASYLINESAAKVMGFANPVGQRISLWGNEGKIIGVLKNFHFESMHTPIEPLILYLQGEQAEPGSQLVVRMQPGHVHTAIESIGAKTKQLDPSVLFRFWLAEEEYRKHYRSEQLVGELSAYFAGLSLLLTCLGVLGLVIFMAEQRRKEIGIRKVLGAGVSRIIALFCREFVKLVLLALAVTTPVVWYVASEWLQGFAYHWELTWWTFAGAGGFTLLTALLTVSAQVIRAALANPAKSLRTD